MDISKNKKKILVAEDEKPMAKALDLKLTKAGFEVKTVFSGAEVLTAVANDTYDLIFLDIVMPNVDGFGVLEKLKEQGNKTPVIVTSNLSQEEDKQRARDLGASDYFVKSNTPIAEVVTYAKRTLGL